MRPSLRVGWLSCGNAVRRWPLIALGGALALFASAALGHIAAVGRALASAAAAPVIVAGVSGALFATAAVRGRRRLASRRHRDWLAALPSDLSLTARAACAPAVVWSGIALAVFAAAAGARLPVADTGSVLLASAAGCAVAASVVALFVSDGTSRFRRSRRPAGESRFVPPASRYAIVRRPRRAWATRPRLSPLGYWPLAQAKFWERPKVRAGSLVLLLIGLPLGVPGAVALAAAVVWLISLHLANTLFGAVRVAFAASRWLVPTPVGLARFTVAIAHRALIAEFAACALLVGMAYAIGGTASLQRTLPAALEWLAAACVLCAAACLLALRTRSVAHSVLHRWMA